MNEVEIEIFKYFLSNIQLLKSKSIYEYCLLDPFFINCNQSAIKTIENICINHFSHSFKTKLGGLYEIIILNHIKTKGWLCEKPIENGTKLDLYLDLKKPLTFKYNNKIWKIPKKYKTAHIELKSKDNIFNQDSGTNNKFKRTQIEQDKTNVTILLFLSLINKPNLKISSNRYTFKGFNAWEFLGFSEKELNILLNQYQKIYDYFSNILTDITKEKIDQAIEFYIFLFLFQC